MVSSSPTDGVPRGLRPIVWLTAVLWLPVRLALRAGDRFLESYEHGADAAGRAVARSARACGRAFLRIFGPLGRLLRRLVTPVWRLVRRLYDRLGLWLLLRLLRPAKRLLTWLWNNVQPLAIGVRRVMAAVVERLEPMWDRVLAWTSAVDAAVTRLGARVRRVLAPVGRALTALSRRPPAH